jgi:hypothetical protein
MSEVEKKEKTLSNAVGKALVLSVSWGWAKDATFLSKTEDEQKKIALTLAYSQLSKLVLSDEGVVGLCQDRISKAVLQEKISRVILSFDPENKQPAPGFSTSPLISPSLHFPSQPCLSQPTNHDFEPPLTSG